MIPRTNADMQCGVIDSAEPIRIRIPTPIDTDIKGGSHYRRRAISGHAGPPGDHTLYPSPTLFRHTTRMSHILLGLRNGNVVADIGAW